MGANHKDPIHVYVSTRAHRDLQVFAEDRGVTLTGLIEVFAHHLPEVETALPGLVTEARAHDANSRRRRRRTSRT